MFESWSPEFAAAATRVPIWTRPDRPSFTARAPGAPAPFAAWAESPPDDIDTGPADAFAQGFQAGHDTAMETLASERGAVARLAQAIEGLRPEPAADLAKLLAETVSRLVRQVMGEVTIDTASLAERTQSIAALIAEETQPARLRLNPLDLARLGDADIGAPLVADPSLPEGTILAETAGGWIEDGPAIRLERLRAQLDQMSSRR